MISQIALFLDDATVAHIDWVAEELKLQSGRFSRSDAVTWLSKKHRKKVKRKPKVKGRGKAVELHI